MTSHQDEEPQTLGDVLARIKPLPTPPRSADDDAHARSQQHNDALAQLQMSALAARVLAQNTIANGTPFPDSLQHFVPGRLLGPLAAARAGGSSNPWTEQSPVSSSDDTADPRAAYAKSALAASAQNGNAVTPSPDGNGSSYQASSRAGTLQSNAPAPFDPRLDLLGKIWASPYTLLGAAYGGLGHVYGLATGKHPEINLGNNAVQFINNPFVNKNSAVTLGNTILYGQGNPPTRNGAYEDPNVNSGKHEEGHTYQYQTLGPLFLPAYMVAGGVPTGPADASGKLGNVFEDAAQRYGSGQGSWWPW
jgi:hypothetical protein